MTARWEMTLGDLAAAEQPDPDGTPDGPDGDDLLVFDTDRDDGATIKTIMKDVADNLFNPDPHYQQGGDMVRVSGMTYAMDPKVGMGSRIQDMRINGKPIDADKTYKVAGWAPVAEGAKGEPVWDVVA